MIFGDIGEPTRFRFLDDPPVDVIATIQELRLTAIVEAGNYVKRISWQRLTNSATSALQSAGIPFHKVSYSAEDNALEIDVAEGTIHAAPRSRRDIQEIVEGELGTGSIVNGAAVNVVVSATEDKPELVDNVMRGGGHLNGGYACTAGFVLRSMGSGAKRLGTAGHCVNNTTSGPYQLHGIDDGDTTRVDSLWTPYDPNTGGFDIGYTSTGAFQAFPSFYFDPGYKRVVSGAASSRYDEGTSVCFYGKTTGWRDACGIVTDAVTNLHIPGTNRTIRGLTETNEAPRDGDSGGPVYRRTWAVGQVSARAGTQYGYFMPVHMYERYGFEVWSD